MLSQEVYKELEDALGPENLSQEPAVLDGYAWQPLWNMGPDMWVPRPEAVTLPGSTEDVQAIIRICNKYGLQFKALSTGWGAIAGPGSEGVIQVDLRRMDRILEIDEKNMYAVVEPYAIGGVIRAEAMKVGLNTHMNSAGAHSSPLASATSAWGCSWDGIFLGWSGRNLLGVEWVLPTGEILELGTLGSGYGWFCGDGPGPSLRGIMRGRCGAFGGNGIFTKAAIKLYNWSGDPTPDAKGLFLDETVKVPDHHSVYLVGFGDRQTEADATLAMARQGIGYNLMRGGIGTDMVLFFPRLFQKKSWREATSLKGAFKGLLRYVWVAILAANSPEELKFQEMVMRQIVADYRGIAFDANDFRLAPFLYWSLICGSTPAVAFRGTGMFNIGWGQDEASHAEIKAQETGEKIKEEWIAKGFPDDIADSGFHFFCEEGNIGHYEELLWYDHRNPSDCKAIWPMELDFTIMQLETCIGSGMDCDPHIRKMFSPLQGNYNQWMNKVREAFDPNGAGDPTFYTAEWDVDPSLFEPAKLQRLQDLLAKNAWTDGDPPE